MYQFKEGINLEIFFRMEKSLVMNGIWAKLPLSSKTIFPTIAVHFSRSGVAFPSQETIAVLSGCTAKTVREGLSGLMGFPNFYIQNYDTNRGKRAKKYKMKMASTEKGKSFRIYKSFFTGGNWSQLSSAGKSIYPVILAFSYFDINIYNSLLDDESEFEEPTGFFNEEGFKNRSFDIAAPDKDLLAKYSGVCHRSVHSALESLEKNFFIERVDEYFKIFIAPKKIYKPEWLNLKTSDKNAL